MKLRHLLFGLLAGVAFVACTNDDDPANVSPVNGGDKVATAPKYMKVNFVMPGATTRADDDAEGTKEESAITSAAFLFFKGDAQVALPFVIAADGNDAVYPKDQSLSEKWTNTSEAVVVLAEPTDIPTSLVVLINADLKVVLDLAQDADATAIQNALYGKKLSDLKAIAKDFSAAEEGTFVMSNAVYNDASNTTVVGAPVGADNVCETPDAARSNPVQVNVERVVAKVNVTNGATAEGAINSQVEDVKIVLKGWALVYENTRSNLIKNLATSYTDPALPTAFKWNDAANKRSYWATPAPYLPNKDQDEKVTGPTYSGIAEGFTKNVYTQENTVSALNGFAEPTMDKQGNLVYPNENPTAVIVTAQLQDKDKKPLDVYRWANTLLADDAIKTLLVNKAAKKYSKLVDGAYIPLEASDFTAMQTDPAAGFDYQVNKYLETSLDKVYEVNKNEQTGEVTVKEVLKADANKDLKENLGELVEYFNGGATYYYVPIKQHIANPQDQADKDVYGIVRNNFYKLTITSVTGLGTAVPDPTKPIIPDTPDDEDSKYYIAAKIQVLNWNLVQQNVKLGE